MVSIKITLLLAAVVSVQASPAATTTKVFSPEVTVIIGHGPAPPVFPKGAIDISNNRTLIDQVRRENGLAVLPTETSTPAPKAGGFNVLSGACDQGACPDYDKPFDMIYTWTQINQPGSGGAPPAPIVWNDLNIRVNDCGQCQSKRVGSSGGGCYDFTGCGRPQSICVDDPNNRAHRIWKDLNVKKCYSVDHVGLGGCGFIVTRIIWRPQSEVACNW